MKIVLKVQLVQNGTPRSLSVRLQGSYHHRVEGSMLAAHLLPDRFWPLPIKGPKWHVYK